MGEGGSEQRGCGWKGQMRPPGGREARFSRAHAPSPGMIFFLELLFLFKRSLNVLSSLSSRHR